MCKPRANKEAYFDSIRLDIIKYKKSLKSNKIIYKTSMTDFHRKTQKFSLQNEKYLMSKFPPKEKC